MRRSRTLLVVGAATLCGMPSAQAEVKKSIAVAPIGSTAGTVAWISGEAIQAQLVTELDKTGRYRVVERENLDGILKEQDLGTEGRMRKGSAPETGDLEGAQMMIKCMITDAEEESGKRGNAGFGGVSLGGAKTIYRVTMDARIYDTQTGLILKTATATAEQEKKDKSGGVGLGGLSLGGGKNEGDTTGAVTRELIKQALAAIDEQANVLGWKSTIISVKDDKFVILGGERDGLEKGMKFTVYSLGEQVKDEETGEVLDQGEEKEIGEITLDSVKEKVAYAVKAGGQDPAKGNVVKLKK